MSLKLKNPKRPLPPIPMAVARRGFATISFVRLPTLTYSATNRLRLKPLLASSISTPFPSKRRNRENHLRRKILKTLTKPFPSAPLPEIETLPATPLISITSPPENDAVFHAPSDQIPGEIFPAGEGDKVENFRFLETINTPVEYSGSVGKISAWSVFKFGGCLVGVLVFAVWVLGYNSSVKQENKLDNLDNKGNVLLNGNGNVGYLDEAQLEEKINEIRTMARAARESERKESNEGNEESDIGKEIDARLAKLEKRLNSKKSKLPESFINYLGLFGNAEDDFNRDSLDLKEDNKTLMFKKNIRFKSRSFNPNNNPKGFSGLKDGVGLSRISGDDPNGDSKQNDSGSMKIDSEGKAMSLELNSSHNEGSKLEMKRASLHEEIVSGAVKETSKKAGKSRDLETKNSQSLTTENQKATINGSRDSGNRSVTNNGDKQSDARTDLWWLNLPYVLAILMRRGSEHEEPGGLYTLRVTSRTDDLGASQTDDLGDSSYTVAFEDRGDANNFCYLLESFFEDLGDFSADIVPLSIKELHEAVKSHSKKVFVVKKGQLKLYVGQPFAEVEMALCSLLEQNQII